MPREDTLMFGAGSVPVSRIRRAAPALLLLLALSTVFVFGNDRELLYRPGHHGGGTAEYLAVSTNLSPEHNFLMFWWERVDADGSLSYRPYNRFPIGGPALVKLATMPFSGSLTEQVYAARMLMLMFFAGAGVLAYISLARLVSSRWISLIATTLAFSSCYCLYYNDFVCPEAMMDLCGFMLTFHGMVVFVQEGHFRQLLAKVSLALLVGWHVYALLLPFIVFGIAGELLRTSEPSRVWARLASSSYLRLGVFSVSFGTLVLGFNFANEYFAIDAHSVTELPSFQSMLVADDGSTDATPETLRREAAGNPGIRFLLLCHRGKGWAVKHGMLAAHGTYRLLCDADLAVPIDQVERLLPPGAPDVDIAIGSREAPGADRRGEPKRRHVMGRVFNALVRMFLVAGVQDTQCGFKCFRGGVATELFARQTIHGFAFDVEVLHLAQAHGLSWIETGIHWYYREGSKVRPGRDSLAMVLDLAIIRWRHRAVRRELAGRGAPGSGAPRDD